MVKSPLRYPGGKSKAIKFIFPLIPHFEEFREPFLGGGSVFLYLKQKYPNRNYWINDLYPNLFYFWKQAQKNVQDLFNQIYEWKNRFNNGKELYYFLLENIDFFDEVKKGAAFFILNRITFSGTSESGGFSQSAYEKRFTLSSLERLKKMAPILKKTDITNYDYQDLIKKEGKNVFIFLDPPYYSTQKSALYGKNGNLHKEFNHERLSENLKKVEHKWLITYDDSEYIRKLFSFAQIQKWSFTYGMRNINQNKNQEGQELFISNYKLSIDKKGETLFYDLYIKR